MGTRITVRKVLHDYLKEHVGVDPETGRAVSGATGVAAPARQWIAARRLVDLWGNKPVSDIDIPASRRYRDARARAEPPAGPSTVRRELTVLVAAANHAVRWRRLPADKLPQVELPPHAPVEEAQFLSKAEVRELLSLSENERDPRLHAFVVLAYLAGARRKSIERLTKAQVNLDRARLHLTPAGKARTKKRAPIVPINAPMAAEIRRLMLWSGQSEYLFRDPHYDVYRPFRALCAAAGVADRGNPHILRHSRATHLLQDGVSVWDVAKLLGDTVETVERVYGHHCPDHMAAQAAFSDLASVLG